MQSLKLSTMWKVSQASGKLPDNFGKSPYVLVNPWEEKGTPTGYHIFFITALLNISLNQLILFYLL